MDPLASLSFAIFMFLPLACWWVSSTLGLPWWLSDKESACQCRRHRFDPWVRKIPWRRDRLHTPVFMGFLGGSDGKESICNAGDLGSIHGLGRSPGRRYGNPLQYSCLENSHWQRSLAGYGPWSHKELNMTKLSTALPILHVLDILKVTSLNIQA